MIGAPGMGSKGYLSSLAKVGDCFAGGVQLQQQGRGLLTHRFFDQRDLVGRLPAEKLLQTLGVGLDVPAPASPHARVTWHMQRAIHCPNAGACPKSLRSADGRGRPRTRPEPLPLVCRAGGLRVRTPPGLGDTAPLPTDGHGRRTGWRQTGLVLRARGADTDRSPAYAPGGRRDPALDETRDLVDEWLEYAAVPGRSGV
ncbi:hypothetical protein [Streptomyces sp. enrichment culture]|uniref:hypothetical protein n=1 Tax=Streptomyces sp. enrichment culture TaxID=1795815 RepID=UPI003F57C39E